MVMLETTKSTAMLGLTPSRVEPETMSSTAGLGPRSSFRPKQSCGRPHRSSVGPQRAGLRWPCELWHPLQQRVEQVAVFGLEEALGGRGPIEPSGVKVVDRRQCGELLVGEAVQPMMEEGELSVAPFHAGAGALEPLCVREVVASADLLHRGQVEVNRWRPITPTARSSRPARFGGPARQVVRRRTLCPGSSVCRHPRCILGLEGVER